MNDILSRKEIETLVTEFYARVRKDELLSPVFAHLDWPHHLPVMFNFWSSVLLGDMSYTGSPFPKHVGLQINEQQLNRVASPRFPNTIYEVIYQRGQFPPAYKSGFATSEPTEQSVLAAKRALMGVVVAKDCLFFNNRPFTSKADSFYNLIEGDYFYF